MTIAAAEVSLKTPQFWCRFETLDTLFFEGEILQAHLPALDGDLTILPFHMDLLTFLRSGLLRLVLPGGHNIQAFFISSGFAEIEKGKLRILGRQATLFREETFSPFSPELMIFGEEED